MQSRYRKNEVRILVIKLIPFSILLFSINILVFRLSSLLYGICFSGSSLVDWLVQNGVVKDNEEANVYANKLLYGRVIRHIYNTEYFYNSPSILYTFIAGSTGNWKRKFLLAYFRIWHFAFTRMRPFLLKSMLWLSISSETHELLWWIIIFIFIIVTIMCVDIFVCMCGASS